MKNKRHIFTILLIISLLTTLLITGCTGKTATQATPARTYDIVKVINTVDLQGAKWKTYQLRLTLEGGATFTVDLNLANGNKVDCLYTTEKPASGGSVQFQVKAGTTIIYPPVTASTTVTSAPGNTSDRFSFTATQIYGSSYRLVFHSNLVDKNAKETIYAEITFPGNDTGEDSIFIPIETN